MHSYLRVKETFSQYSSQLIFLNNLRNKTREILLHSDVKLFKKIHSKLRCPLLNISRQKFKEHHSSVQHSTPSFKVLNRSVQNGISSFKVHYSSVYHSISLFKVHYSSVHHTTSLFKLHHSSVHHRIIHIQPHSYKHYNTQNCNSLHLG